MAPNLHLGKIITKTAIAGRYNQAAIWGGGLLRGVRVHKGRWHQTYIWARLLQRLQLLVGTTKLLYGGGGYLGVSECIKEDGTKLTSGQDYYKDCNRW